jgi:parvulin-like peptidyl-prolyl isomerase
MEAKIEYLEDELFGADGSKLSPNLFDEYFSQMYACFKQVFFYSYSIVYETDENGDSIYYTKDGKIAYDTTKDAKLDSDGKKVKDKNGDVVFLNEDGKIAYDKKNGTRKAVVDSSGNTVIEEFSAEKINQIKEKATAIMNEVEKGDYVKFDALVEEHSMDPGIDKYPNGYYVTATTNYSSPEVIKALFEMEEGEVRLIKSDYGFHVVMKYELGEKPYEKEENADFFVNAETGKYHFVEDMISNLFIDYLKPYTDNIVINEEVYKTVSIKTVGANFYY